MCGAFDLRKQIAGGDLAGVILFSENLPSRSVGRALIRKLQAIPRPKGLRAPLLVMIDQEGGLVKRLSGAPNDSASRRQRVAGLLTTSQGGDGNSASTDSRANAKLACKGTSVRP